MSLLEQNTIKKGQVNALLELELELDTGEDKEYKGEAIKNNTIYAKTAES